MQTICIKTEIKQKQSPITGEVYQCSSHITTKHGAEAVECFETREGSLLGQAHASTRIFQNVFCVVRLQKQTSERFLHVSLID